MIYLIDSIKGISLKVAKFGSLDIVELHGDILQPGGQLETPGLVVVTLGLQILDFENKEDSKRWEEPSEYIF